MNLKTEAAGFRLNPRVLLIAFAVLLCLIQAGRIAATGYTIGSDGLGYYAHLRSPFIDGDFHYANEFAEYNPRNHAVPDPGLRTSTGHVPNKFYIGPAILWLPFFLVAHGLTALAVLFGSGLEINGYSILYQVFVALGSLVYGLAGLVFIYRIVRHLFSVEEAIVSTGLIALATNVIFYLTAESTMAHSMSLFAVSLFAWIWIRDLNNRNKRSLILLGLAAGLMTLIRPQNVLFTSLLFLELLGFLKGGSDSPAPLQERIRNVLVFGGVFFLVLIPQFIVWKILYGKFLVLYSYEGEGFYFLHPQLLETLFSSRHGLISWTPVLLPALAGVIIFMFRKPVLGAALLLVFILQLYVNASWYKWWFGNSFGGRAFISCSFVFAIGLAAFLNAVKKWKLPVNVLLAVFVCWNFLFVMQYAMKLIPADQAVDLRMVVSNLPVFFRRFPDLVRVFF